jgi:hypothetical protein
MFWNNFSRKLLKKQILCNGVLLSSWPKVPFRALERAKTHTGVCLDFSFPSAGRQTQASACLLTDAGKQNY